MKSIIERIQRKFKKIIGYSAKDYLNMQRQAYQQSAAAGKISPGNIECDNVVGFLKEHNSWQDYSLYLMQHVPENKSWTALEYGCGPGRNILRWSEIFSRIDGVDISENNLKNAETFLEGKISKANWPNLYITDGNNCGEAKSDYYDFVFSTICLQHICCYDIRKSILTDLFRCLKPGGRLSAQMGYGVPSPDTVGYYENNFSARGTNRACDVAIESPEQVKKDLMEIGFSNFESFIRPVGPGDLHPNWIFFTATKP
jgi:ubiquinone/menaquinone biosynthesis C-methylase UbiE